MDAIDAVTARMAQAGEGDGKISPTAKREFFKNLRIETSIDNVVENVEHVEFSTPLSKPRSIGAKNEADEQKTDQRERISERAPKSRGRLKNAKRGAAGSRGTTEVSCTQVAVMDDEGVDGISTHQKLAGLTIVSKWQGSFDESLDDDGNEQENLPADSKTVGSEREKSSPRVPAAPTAAAAVVEEMAAEKKWRSSGKKSMRDGGGILLKSDDGGKVKTKVVIAPAGAGGAGTNQPTATQRPLLVKSKSLDPCFGAELASVTAHRGNAQKNCRIPQIFVETNGENAQQNAEKGSAATTAAVTANFIATNPPQQETVGTESKSRDSATTQGSYVGVRSGGAGSGACVSSGYSVTPTSTTAKDSGFFSHFRSSLRSSFQDLLPHQKQQQAQTTGSPSSVETNSTRWAKSDRISSALAKFDNGSQTAAGSKPSEEEKEMRRQRRYRRRSDCDSFKDLRKSTAAFPVPVSPDLPVSGRLSDSGVGLDHSSDALKQSTYDNLSATPGSSAKSAESYHVNGIPVGKEDLRGSADSVTRNGHVYGHVSGAVSPAPPPYSPSTRVLPSRLRRYQIMSLQSPSSTYGAKY